MKQPVDLKASAGIPDDIAASYKSDAKIRELFNSKQEMVRFKKILSAMIKGSDQKRVGNESIVSSEDASQRDNQNTVQTA